MDDSIGTTSETFDWVFAIDDESTARLPVSRISADALRPHLRPGTRYRVIAINQRPRASLIIGCQLDKASNSVRYAPHQGPAAWPEPSNDQDLVFACITDASESIGLHSCYWTLSDYLARAMPTWPTIDAVESALSKYLRHGGVDSQTATVRYPQLKAMWRAKQIAAALPDDYSAIIAAWPRHYGAIGSSVPTKPALAILALAALTASVAPPVGLIVVVVLLTLVAKVKLKWRRLRSHALDLVMNSSTLMQFLHERRALKLRITATGQPVSPD